MTFSFIPVVPECNSTSSMTKDELICGVVLGAMGIIVKVIKAWSGIPELTESRSKVNGENVGIVKTIL